MWVASVPRPAALDGYRAKLRLEGQRGGALADFIRCRVA